MARLSDKIPPLIRVVAPPFALSLARSLARRVQGKSYEWEYMPSGWQAERDNAAIKGWNVQSVLDAYVSKWPGFINSLDSTAPFGLPEPRGAAGEAELLIHNTWLSYAYALHAASRGKDSLTLLDWGGGIGHYYHLSRTMVPEVRIEYACKDFPLFAEYGRQLIPEGRFYSDDTCLNQLYDFVLSSSSLQYSKTWEHTLAQLASATGGYLFLTRLPIVLKASSFVVVQRPYSHGYATEYLGWCINRDQLLRQAETTGLELVREFILGDRYHIHKAPEQPDHRGFLFRQSGRAR